ncbi:MAG: YbhB/YbcL family Raf kinase inhibitor-like protein [Terracidiphilus sp.]|jgi:hypothetical protein
MLKRLGLFVAVAVILGSYSANAISQSTADVYGNFQLRSTEFENQGVIPLSAVLNNQVNGVNSCSANGAAGGDRSPELYWIGAPEGSKSFVVVLYDVTAAFTHWGMYNISGNATRLPADAGVAGSIYGQQIMNDFALGDEYDGPCPPAGVAPDAHEYVFTIYALSGKLDLPSSTNFPANSETLYQALIRAGEKGEILGSATLTGYYSSTPKSSAAAN